MHIKQLFPEILSPRLVRTGKFSRCEQDGGPDPKQFISFGQRTLLKPTTIHKMPAFIKTPYMSMKRHYSAPNMRVTADKLASVTEEEDEAFKYQMALLDDPPEWDLDAGIGSRDFETPSHTPPAITASRASSPSKIEKVTEGSKKKLLRLKSMIQISTDKPVKVDDDERLSKSLPDLSKLSGKGHAGSLSQSKEDGRGRSRSIDRNAAQKPRSKSGPPSWRLPPQSVASLMPHVRDAIPPSSFPIGHVDVKHHDSSVMARAMWKHGEVRYEDQWGHRLVPVGRQNSFMFELWPVSETMEDETPAVEKLERIVECRR